MGHHALPKGRARRRGHETDEATTPQPQLRPGGPTVPVPGLANAQPGVAPAPIRRWPWSKKKKPLISAPTGGRAMTKQEQGGVPSAKELIGIKETEDELAQLGAIDMEPDPEVEKDRRKRELRKLNMNPEVPAKIANSRLLPAGTEFHAFEGTTWKKSALGSVFSVSLTDMTPVPGHPEYLELTLGGKRYAFLAADVEKGAKAQYELDDQPVFAKDKSGQVIAMPTPADVKQGRLGDCYLEAALSSLAKSDPQAIVDMIKDYGKTVAVTLHDVDKSTKPPTFTKRTVRVEKSRIRQGGALALDQGALWVGMIEKAYAAGRFSGTETGEQSAKAQDRAKFDSIDGGHPFHALEVLTGKPAGYILTADAVAAGATALPWGPEEVKEYDTVAKAKGGSYTGLASFTALKAKAKVDTWMTWLKADGGPAIAELLAKAQSGGDLAKVIRVEDFEQLFVSKNLGSDVATPMLTYLEGHFPGKRGTGKYTKGQLDLFVKIEEALTQNKNVVAASREKIAKGPTAQGHSGGEAVAKGLVGGHAFTVIGVERAPDGIKYVKMRNPWGKYGRSYVKETNGGKAKLKTQAVDDGDGVSSIELSDVTKRFERFDIQ